VRAAARFLTACSICFVLVNSSTDDSDVPIFAHVPHSYRMIFGLHASQLRDVNVFPMGWVTGKQAGTSVTALPHRSPPSRTGHTLSGQICHIIGNQSVAPCHGRGSSYLPIALCCHTRASTVVRIFPVPWHSNAPVKTRSIVLW